MVSHVILPLTVRAVTDLHRVKACPAAFTGDLMDRVSRVLRDLDILSDDHPDPVVFLLHRTSPVICIAEVQIDIRIHIRAFLPAVPHRHSSPVYNVRDVLETFPIPGTADNRKVLSRLGKDNIFCQSNDLVFKVFIAKIRLVILHEPDQPVFAARSGKQKSKALHRPPENIPKCF